MSDDDDERCMQRLAAGDVRALGVLYARHRGVVMSVLRQHRQTPTDAEDLCHDVFLALKGFAPKFRAGASVRALLVGIASRKGLKWNAVSWLRRSLLDRHQPHDAPTAQPHAQLDARHDAQRLLARLPEGWRTVVLLNLVEGWTAEEIGEALGLSPNTVFTRLHRARQQLRGALEESVTSAPEVAR
ncbi:MAG: RNA polymerase sigma factor [Archangium sp.]|nr:RNA polymerase sigma factor [Archangium sp.]